MLANEFAMHAPALEASSLLLKKEKTKNRESKRQINKQ